MNKRITTEQLRGSLERQLSGLKPDPLLARRVMASGRVSARKPRLLRPVLVLAVLMALTGAAYAVTALYRVVNWQGGITRTVAPPQTPDRGAAAGGARDAGEALASFISEIPDDETVFAWIEGDDGLIARSELHKKQKAFSSHEAFAQYMAGSPYLTAPSQLPDETLDYYAATAYMECKAFGAYAQTGNGQAGPVRYTRFLIDDESAVATGYSLVLTLADGSCLRIESGLREASSEEPLMLREGETAEKVAVSGMSDALLIRSADPASPDGLIMRRKLSDPAKLKLLPLNDHLEPGDGVCYTEEYITVWLHNRKDPQLLLRLFSGA